MDPYPLNLRIVSNPFVKFNRTNMTPLSALPNIKLCKSAPNVTAGDQIVTKFPYIQKRIKPEFLNTCFPFNAV